MFGGWAGQNYANSDDPLAKQRDAPPQPLPIQFPEYCPALKDTPLTAQKHASLKRLIMGIKNPTDISPQHIEAFNVKYRSNTAISDLVPTPPNGLLEEATFNVIVKDEFSLENDPCFRKVCRLPPENGQTLPRLAHAYLFFKNLEDMSRYWDNSKDNYFEKTEPAASSPKQERDHRSSLQKENVKPTIDANGDTPMADSSSDNARTPKKLYIGRRNGNASSMPPLLRDGVLEGLLRTASQKFNAVCKPPTQQYTRLQVGEMLIPVRQTFVVGRVPTDRLEARKAKTLGPLLVGSARMEIEFRKDDEKVGEGQGEIADFLRELGGLLLLAQQRNREGRTETPPGSAESCWWVNKERWGGGKGGKMPHEEAEAVDELPKVADDAVMKEVPNGHTRVKRSLDVSTDAGAAGGFSNPPPRITSLTATSTIASNTRLSGSSHAAVANSTNSPTSSSPASAPPPIASTSTRTERPPMSSRRIKMMCESWKRLRPPSPLWDPGLTCQAIGKVDGPDGEWDDVFMVSALNSHVSILRLRISKGYLAWLEGGVMSAVPQEKRWGRSGITLPRVEEERRDWEGTGMQREVLYLERSVWWDLFQPAERVEALGALWRVFSWLSREVGGGKLPWSVE